MTADGSDDNKVSPESLPEYKIPPPSIADASASLPVSNEVEPAENEEEAQAGEGEEEEEEDEILVEESDNPDPSDIAELEDKECDRFYDDECIGREVRALYENGWFTGEIIYFNTVLAKHLVEYADSSTELVDIEDFDDTTMILL